MTFLVSTTQRCGSTWLTRMLAAMTGTPDLYVDGLQMGFSLAAPREPGAADRLAHFLRERSEVSVFKTHDVPSVDFDAVCAAVPELRILTMKRDFKDVVVSRYFFLRHHWPTDPGLGPRPKWFAEYLATIGDAPDREALPALLEARVLRTWAREWAAFEGTFATPHAMRLGYTTLMDESDYPRLEAFAGFPVRESKRFAAEQEDETLQTGRVGNARFHRDGRAGQWRDWFTDGQGSQLDALAVAAMEKSATYGRGQIGGV
ncbi:MAG: sulfotransferase domain-containing protein [Chthoniobacteraceae bacterium]